VTTTHNGWMAYDKNNNPIDYTFTCGHPRMCEIRLTAYYNETIRQLAKHGVHIHKVRVVKGDKE
jgi:hypothetical protein